MNSMKYIIVDDGLFGTPFIFDESINHSYMAHNVGGEVISAGFIKLNKDGVRCFGRSTSLNVDSRPDEDRKLVMKMLGANND